MSDAILMKSGGLQFRVHCSTSQQPSDRSLLWVHTDTGVASVAVVTSKPATVGVRAGVLYLITGDNGMSFKLVDDLDVIEVKLVDAYVSATSGQLTNVSMSIHDGTTWVTV